MITDVLAEQPPWYLAGPVICIVLYGRRSAARPDAARGRAAWRDAVTAAASPGR